MPKNLKVKKLTKSKNNLAKNRSKRLAVKKVVKANKQKYHRFSKKKLKIILAMVIILLFAVYGFNYMFKAVNSAKVAYDRSNISADSMLAYDKYQIAEALIIGDKQHLISEISGFYAAPTDLQNYVLKDYRNYKKMCVVNGNLTGVSSYIIRSVVYQSYALVGKNCNGTQKSILAKINNVWTTIYSANDIAPCSLVNDYNIPKGVSLRCVADGVTYLNPNP